ncbi:hypothetical protein K2173_007852 [Erythroxylum novogranatense]|uniref:cyclin-dependent kinase n=1 Tax=Erythroxylum novogranatense TaxID=1862640 RepID=A0AAV8S7F0_9ROSI|nr:hypothetical protein K2173_007852 [Erythroxylum novogranatense]
MAAGRVDVSRRHESYRYSKRDFERRQSSGRGVGLNQGLVHEKECFASSGLRNLDYRRSGFNCRDEERELGEFWRGDVQNSCPRSKDGEISSSQDGVQLPPEKKRKFSPIIWDIVDKNVRSSSEKRIDSKSNTLLAPQSSRSPLDHGSNVTYDRSLSKDPVSEIQIGGESVVISSSLVLEEEHGTNGKLQGEREHETTEVRNIYMSRWASDDDSPLSNHEDMSGKTFNRKSSSPESGEFLREELDGEQARLSVHSERDVSENDNLMEVDSIHDEGLESNQVESISDSFQVGESEDATHRSVNMLECCRSVFEYERLNEINEGTYGKVYRARDKKTGEIVALKKVKMALGRDRNLEEYGFPLTALREINILLSFRHPSIVNVKEVVMDDHDGVFMVMEYMEHDLKGMMQMMKQPFSTSEVKCLMLQLLEGIKHLHDNWVLHRDLKTSNLLMNNQGELKICDFGMSRLYGSPLKPYTSLVVTMWYRAPELLLGAKEYSTAVDMWSVGCIMAELLTKEPLFRGRNEIDQLDKIVRMLGAPNDKIWPEFSKLPGAKAKFVRQPYNMLRKKFPATSFTGSPALSDSGFDLLNGLLTYDPKKRITAEAALNHPWFHEVPSPKSKELMPTFPPLSAKKR